MLALHLFLELCCSAILGSDLQMELSPQLANPSDVLKTGLVTKNWNGARFFKKINSEAVLILFQNKQTNEIIFQTKPDYQTVLVDLFGLNAEQANRVEELIRAKNWNKLFRKLIYWRNCFQDFLDALAEIVEVNKKCELAGTSVHLATTWRTTSLLEILLKRSETNPNLKDKFGDTALHRAAKYNKVAHIELLVAHGAQVDATNDRLRTPLMLVADNVDGTLATAVALLKHGADPNRRDELGQSAIYLAATNKKEVLLPVLFKYRAEIDQTDQDLKIELRAMGFEI